MLNKTQEMERVIIINSHRKRHRINSDIIKKIKYFSKKNYSKDQRKSS